MPNQHPRASRRVVCYTAPIMLRWTHRSAPVVLGVACLMQTVAVHATGGAPGASGEAPPRPTPSPAQAAPSQKAGEIDRTPAKKGDEIDRTPRAPMPPPGELARCLQLIRSGNYAVARARLEPIVANHPGWARAHFLLALTHHKQQHYELAEPLFARSVLLDPKQHAVHVFYAWCLYYRGKPAKSGEMFEAYLVMEPGYPDAIFGLGLIDFDEDNIDSAEQRFREAIKLSIAAGDQNTEAKTRARLADVLVRKGELEPARAELERSVALNPDNYEAYYKLSRVLQRLGDADGAKKAREMHKKVRDRLRPRTAPPKRESER